MPALPGGRGLFEHPSPQFLVVPDRSAFSRSPVAEPRRANSDVIVVPLGAGSHYEVIHIGVHDRAFPLVDCHEVRARFPTPSNMQPPRALRPPSDMGAVSCAIWGHDAEGIRPWHDRRIEATFSFRQDKTDPAIGEKAVELDHTEALSTRFGCVGRCDRSKLAQHQTLGAVPVNRLCARALANATAHLPGPPESRCAAKTLHAAPVRRSGWFGSNQAYKAAQGCSNFQ